MHLDNNTRAFFALVKAGLWEQDVHLTSFNKIEFQEINRLAEEQTVVGLVAAGLEHVTDMKVSKEDLLQFVGRALQLEQRNESMNNFVGCLVKRCVKMRFMHYCLKDRELHSATRGLNGVHQEMWISS